MHRSVLRWTVGPGPWVAFPIGALLPSLRMLFGFINRVSSAASLRSALDVSAARTRAIGDRVAKASLNNGDGFAMAATAAESPTGAPPGPPVDLESEMVSLADEQLRYEATAKLLEKTYQTIRLSLRDR